mmetsp:Transcript_45319/g.51316  ORF Transcript_45319/g.51316 Transcript_45319/m.51316 type:complete len:618 (-) Transcript_45319:82-1935(-)
MTTRLLCMRVIFLISLLIGRVDAIQSLADFAASMVEEADEGDVTLISGNEAGDADSIITALTYAYLLHIEQTESKDDDTEILLGSNSVAYAKFLREDMPMRAETEIILKEAGVNSADLLFSDDPTVSDLLSRTTQVVLTDHNQADAELVPYGENVIQILDHHTDFNDHLHVMNDNRLIAFNETTKKATAASACTVICEKYLEYSSGTTLLKMNDGAIAQALLSVILIDGSNMEISEGGKLTPRDMKCLDVLQNILSMDEEDSTVLYEQLDDAKKDPALWADQSAAQILRYDFKKFKSTDGTRSVGISSCPTSLEDISAKEDWADSLAERAADYDLYIVMTKMTKEDGFKGKELLFTACNVDLVSEAADFFTSYDNDLLELEPLEVSPVPDFSRAFDQINTKPGRKQIGPISQEFLDTIPNEPDCDAITEGELSVDDVSPSENGINMSTGDEATILDSSSNSEDHTDTCSTIFDLVCETEGFDILCGLLASVGLQDALSGGSWTVFAPIDEAFFKIDDALEYGIASIPDDLLLKILQFHVVDDKVLHLDDLPCEPGNNLVKTLSGKDSRTFCEDDVPYGQKGGGNGDVVEFVDVDIDACNGVVHTVADVLLFNLAPYM